MRKKHKLLVSLFSFAGIIGLAGCSGSSPYVGENGNWWINGSDMGVPATGPKGDSGETGSKGDQGNKGDPGEKGESISVVSVTKIKTEGNIDTYEILFSDGTKTTFTVANGRDGSSVSVTDVSLKSSENGIDTYEITFSDGYKTTFTVTNGKDLTILSIEKVSSNGLFDTYRINYSDGKYIEFVVANGVTPYIGDNGNWWINGEDTGVLADVAKEDKRSQTTNSKISSSGLVYALRTIGGKSGYVVTGYDSNLAKTTSLNNYRELANGLSKTEFSSYVDNTLKEMEIIIPNYIGSTPVIGIDGGCLNTGDLKSISLSRNTIYLGDKAFYKTTGLKSFDFNDSQITYIPESCFEGSSIIEISLPKIVTTLYDSAFKDCKFRNLDISNITYFGSYSLYGTDNEYVWLSKNVEYVGYRAFSSQYIYVENGATTSNWNDGDGLNDIAYSTKVITNCFKNGVLIYSSNDDEITAYHWLKNEKDIEIPSLIDGKQVTRIGYGFADDMTYMLNNINSNEDIVSLIGEIDSIKIPTTVKKIEPGAIRTFSAIIYIPSTVEEIDEYICCYGDDYVGFSYLAFENTSLPNFIDYSTQNIITSEEWLNETNDVPRHGLGLDFSKIKYSEEEKTYFYEEETEASVLSCLDLKTKYIVTPSTFNNKPVKTIRPYAYSYLSNLKILNISNSITKIQKYAFASASLSFAFIPSSVTTIGKYALSSVSNEFYIENSSIPDEWDSYWCGTSSHTVYYDQDISSLKVGKFHSFDYFSLEGEVTLYSHDVNSTTLILPSEIDGEPVTTLASNFSSNNSITKFYIPNSITKAHKNAFVTSYKYFYFENSQVPSDFDKNWRSGNGYVYYNQTMPTVDYDLGFAYSETSSNTVLISYVGSNDTIYIPRTINGKTVTTISNGFVMSDKGMNVYIPDNITSVESKAFIATTSDKWTFYFETSYGNDGYYTTTSQPNKTDLYNQKFDY